MTPDQYQRLAKFLRETGRHALVISWVPFLMVIK